MLTGYLGPDGTYSQLAHDKIFANTKKIGFTNFYQIFNAVQNCQIDAAVVPIENSLQGSVTECLDLLYEYKDIYLTQEVQVNIKHGLFVAKGSNLQNIKTLYSHEQAIKQCSKFIAAHLPNVNIVYTASTSKSLELVVDQYSAGIAGSHIVSGNHTLLPQEIADNSDNITRFCVLKKGFNSLNLNGSKVFIAASGHNKPGALLELLTVLKNNKLNMTKIESRPLKTKMGEYVFFIEFEGALNLASVKDAISGIKKAATDFSILGSY